MYFAATYTISVDVLAFVRAPYITKQNKDTMPLTMLQLLVHIMLNIFSSPIQNIITIRDQAGKYKMQAQDKSKTSSELNV